MSRWKLRDVRTMSFRPKLGGMRPEWRPRCMSWKMNGSQRIGTSATYRMAGRATIRVFDTHFTSRAAKW